MVSDTWFHGTAQTGWLIGSLKQAEISMNKGPPVHATIFRKTLPFLTVFSRRWGPGKSLTGIQASTFLSFDLQASLKYGILLKCNMISVWGEWEWRMQGHNYLPFTCNYWMQSILLSLKGPFSSKIFLGSILYQCRQNKRGFGAAERRAISSPGS